MTDLVEWLLAQIADDEQVARAAVRAVIEQRHPPADADQYLADGERWASERHLFHRQPRVRTSFTTTDVAERTLGPVSDHIARWDPARVLAECAAKRKLIALAVEDVRKADDALMGEWGGVSELEHDLLRALTPPYADRPGYLAEWKP